MLNVKGTILEQGGRQRNIGIDVLKIILAFMVIILHINAPSTGQVASHAFSPMVKNIVWGVESLCYVAVNCYVLITGMYSYAQHGDIQQTIKKLSKLWLAVLFYSILGYFSVSIVFHKGFSFYDLFKRVLPITRGKWWFMTNYFFIILCAPFLNKLIDALEKKQIQIFICVMTLGFSIIPFIMRWKDAFGVNYGYSFAWFFQLYITGAYLNKYREDFNKSGFSYLLRYVIASLILFLTIGLFKIPYINLYNFFSYNSIIVYLASVFLVLGFSKLNISIKQRSAKGIHLISGLSLASYLTHCQEDVESVLWKVLNLPRYANSIKIIAVAIGVTAGIYIISIIIEYIRTRAVKIGSFESRFCDFVYHIFTAMNSLVKRLCLRIM